MNTRRNEISILFSVII